MRLPSEITDRYKAWSFTPLSVHPGNSAMYRLTSEADCRFLKVVRKGWFPSAAAEAARMAWACKHLPVPEIMEAGETHDTTWFIASAIAGIDATSEEFRSDVPGLVCRLADALRIFHETPVDDCPFAFRLDDALAHVQRRLRDGEIDPARDFHTEHNHLSARGAIEQLLAARPTVEDLVVCHGDFCVPNILFADRALAGFVDLGEMGVADRWWDLAVATWSLTWNFGPGYEALFLETYGVELDQERCHYYRLLYDVVS